MRLPEGEGKTEVEAGVRRYSGEGEAEVDVHGAGGVGDGAGGDEVGASLGVGADGLEGDAAGEFDRGSARDAGDPLTGLVGGQIVEKQAGGSGGEGFVEFVQSPDFDFGRQWLAVGGGEGGGDAARGGDVVIFDEDGVEEAVAVVGGATGGGGHLFETAESGGGFAGIEDFTACSGNLIGEPGGHGGDPREALDEVERDAFAGQQSARGSGDAGKTGACFDGGARGGDDFERIDGAAEGIDI